MKDLSREQREKVFELSVLLLAGKGKYTKLKEDVFQETVESIARLYKKFVAMGEPPGEWKSEGY